MKNKLYEKANALLDLSFLCLFPELDNLGYVFIGGPQSKRPLSFCKQF